MIIKFLLLGVAIILALDFFGVKLKHSLSKGEYLKVAIIVGYGLLVYILVSRFGPIFFVLVPIAIFFVLARNLTRKIKK